MRSTFIIAYLSLAPLAMAQDDELTEATGLSPESKTEDIKTSSSYVRVRGYAMLDWRSRKGSSDEKTFAPNGEFSLALRKDLNRTLSTFAEGRVFYLRETEETSGVLDQGGFRMNVSDHWSAALGKERNRRAPGLLLSPSDFIHANQSAPGLPEDRSGVWLGRLSWQTEQQSLDFLLLPVSKLGDSGLPDEDAEFLGGAVRWFGRFGGYDLSLDVGSLDDDLKTGASVQTFFHSVWKTYVEAGYDHDKERGSALFGLSYEGNEDYAWRSEVYHNAAGVDKVPTFTFRNTDAANAVTTAPAAATQGLFIRRDYFIGNASLIELWNRINLRETWIKSLEDSGSVHLFGTEYIAGDNNVLGLTWIRIAGDLKSQYGRRPFDWQLLLNWKYSF